MATGFALIVVGVLAILWALLTRRLFRTPDPDETPSEEIRGMMMRYAWPVVLILASGSVVIGLVLVIVGVVRRVV